MKQVTHYFINRADILRYLNKDAEVGGGFAVGYDSTGVRILVAYDGDYVEVTTGHPEDAIIRIEVTK